MGNVTSDLPETQVLVSSSSAWWDPLGRKQIIHTFRDPAVALTDKQWQSLLKRAIKAQLMSKGGKKKARKQARAVAMPGGPRAALPISHNHQGDARMPPLFA